MKIFQCLIHDKYAVNVESTIIIISAFSLSISMLKFLLP